MTPPDGERLFLVTGASSGIGRGIALRLSATGARVVAVGRDAGRLGELVRECGCPERMHPEIRDLAADIELLPQYVKGLKEKYGKFHGMVSCAGISEIRPLQVLRYEDCKRIFDINYFAPLMLAKGLLDRRHNAGRGASLVFIASIEAHLADKGMASYAGSKAALVASVRSISREVAASGIRVNAISPGDVLTPMTAKVEGMRNDRSHLYPLGFGTVDDVAALALFLLSDEAKWITGQNYILDGGHP
ncbi:MAG: SDR family oxidoreductase [Acidobacteria bacterium]|nr:SDR family oxidoreductase [Acidobacteriota bacterium]